jgi:hypothetical protein
MDERSKKALQTTSAWGVGGAVAGYTTGIQAAPEMVRGIGGIANQAGQNAGAAVKHGAGVGGATVAALAGAKGAAVATTAAMGSAALAAAPFVVAAGAAYGGYKLFKKIRGK